MLILSRKVNQSILIGQDIRITIAEIRNKQVVIGIEAPAHLKVIRDGKKRKSRNPAGNQSPCRP